MPQKSKPIPCLSCGADVRKNYPIYVMAAFAGICGTCEQQAIISERESYLIDLQSVETQPGELCKENKSN